MPTDTPRPGRPKLPPGEKISRQEINKRQRQQSADAGLKRVEVLVPPELLAKLDALVADAQAAGKRASRNAAILELIDKAARDKSRAAALADFYGKKAEN